MLDFSSNTQASFNGVLARLDALEQQARTLSGSDAEPARALLSEADALAKETGPLLARARCAQAILFYNLSRNAEARTALEGALEHVNHASENVAEHAYPDITQPDLVRATALCYLSLISVRQGRYKDTLLQGAEALKLSRERGDVRLQAQALNALGGAYHYLGAYEEALENLTESLTLRETIGGTWLFHGYINVSSVYIALERFEAVFDYLGKALLEARKHENRRGEGICLINLGDTYRSVGENERAVEHLRRGVEMLEAAGQSAVATHGYIMLGQTLASLERFTEASESFERALTLFETYPNPHGQAEALSGLGAMLLKQGAFEEALGALVQALAFAEEGESQPNIYKVHLALSEVHKALGRFEEALSHFEVFHRVQEEVFEKRSQDRVQHLMIQFDVERLQQERALVQGQNAELARLNRELEQLSIRDGLTGVYNRRHLDKELAREFERATRYNLPLSVMMSDIDFFKRINDTFSHATGDEVLKILARLFEENTRENDLVARYGGEEFAVVFPETGLERAADAAEKIRHTVEAYPWATVHPDLKVTVSIGVASGTAFENADKFLDKADKELYEAKHSGKNRVCYSRA